MKVAAVSDTHGHLPDIPDCDVLVIAGDISYGFRERSIDRLWLDTNFRLWLDDLRSRGIQPIGVAGNHDFAFESDPEFARSLPWIYLCDSDAVIDGVRFWGMPWQPWFGGWAFNAPRGAAGEAFIGEKLAAVPPDTDVLISHGPPYRACDHTWDGGHVGSTALAAAVKRVRPRLVVCGHIHHAAGTAFTPDGVSVANVAYTSDDGSYKPAGRPILEFTL